jgi:hypothetical protein
MSQSRKYLANPAAEVVVPICTLRTMRSNIDPGRIDLQVYHGLWKAPNQTHKIVLGNEGSFDAEYVPFLVGKFAGECRQLLGDVEDLRDRRKQVLAEMCRVRNGDAMRDDMYCQGTNLRYEHGR